MAAEMADRIGARIRARREELGLTQAEVARRMPGTTTSDQLSRWERGKHQPQNLDSLAKALEVDVSYFYVAAPTSTETPDPFPTMDAADRLARIERQLGEFKSEVLDELAGVREDLRKAFAGRTEQGGQIIERLEALEKTLTNAIVENAQAAAEDEWVERVVVKARAALAGDAPAPGSRPRRAAKSGSPRA